MADNGGNNDDVFIYMGGDQEVPRDVTHVRVHKSVKVITRQAFYYCRDLVSIEMHDGVEIIEEYAFSYCSSLIKIKLPGVRVIENGAFWCCTKLEDVEFGNKLESIGYGAFKSCTSLKKIKIPKVRDIGIDSFCYCEQLTEAELSKDLERIGVRAFYDCPRLRRITIPLKDNLLGGQCFTFCENLSQVDLVEEIHKKFSSLLLDSWRNEMKDEINRINWDLHNAEDKTGAIQRWIGRALERIEHYKSEHYALLKNNMSQFELALWKVKLQEIGDDEEVSLSSDLCALWKEKMTLLELARWKTKFYKELVVARQKARVTCGANIIIPHVLSFLNDEDIFPLLQYDHQP